MNATKQAWMLLTKPQAEWVRWALDGPISEWGDIGQFCWDRGCEPEEARQAIRDRDASSLKNTVLILDAEPNGDFVADLLNMLEDVAPDVEDGYGFEDAQTKHGYKTAFVVTSARKRAALKAAAMIREAMQLEQP